MNGGNGGERALCRDSLLTFGQTDSVCIVSKSTDEFGI